MLLLKVQISLEPKISCIADPSLTSRIAESKLSREILSAFLSKLNFWRFSAFFLPFCPNSRFHILHSADLKISFSLNFPLLAKQSL